MLQLHQVLTKFDQKQTSFIKGLYLSESHFFTHPLGKHGWIFYLDRCGWTPIHCAAFNGHLDIVKFLVGLTDTPLNYYFLHGTPIEIAKDRGHVEVQKFLENHCKYLITKVKKGLLEIDRAHNWNFSQTFL